MLSFNLFVLKPGKALLLKEVKKHAKRCKLKPVIIKSLEEAFVDNKKGFIIENEQPDILAKENFGVQDLVNNPEWAIFLAPGRTVQYVRVAGDGLF
jgi:hypothetical protein